MGTCVYLTYQTGQEFLALTGMPWGTGGVATWNPTNAEQAGFSQAMYRARERAVGRIHAEARELGAAGIVGTRITLGEELSKSDSEFANELSDPKSFPAQVWRHYVVDVFTVGTAIAPISADHPIPQPRLVLPVDQ
jgi:hypothetical protein